MSFGICSTVFGICSRFLDLFKEIDFGPFGGYFVVVQKMDMAKWLSLARPRTDLSGFGGECFLLDLVKMGKNRKKPWALGNWHRNQK